MHNRYMEKEGTPKPAGKPSPGDLSSDSFGLYFKGLIRHETGLLAGFGVAIRREEDGNILFQMKGSLQSSSITSLQGSSITDFEADLMALEAELMALKLGLTQAVSLGIEHISIYCDNNQIYELVMGRYTPEQENIAFLLMDVQHIRQELESSVPVLVTENQTKFVSKLAMEATVLSDICTSLPRATRRKTCVICFNDDIKAEEIFDNASCSHQSCVECMKQHIELKLIEGSVPRCPDHSCESNLSLKGCAHLLTPKLKEIWEQRIRENEIPVCERFHCPNPRCWALMSKTEVFESSEDGVRRCCLKCHKPFCINCKVPWHNNLSCEEYKTRGTPNPTTLLSRQCQKCQHMIKLSRKKDAVTCRCGFRFCYTCGAQWKHKGCSHRQVWEDDLTMWGVLSFILISFAFIILMSALSHKG